MFPLVFDKNLFDFRKFFAEFVKINLEEYDAGIIEPAEKLDEFNIRLRKKAFKKRILSRLDLSLNGETKVGVKLLSMVKKIAKPGNVPFHKKTGELLTNVTWNKTIGDGFDGIVQKQDTGRFLRATYPLDAMFSAK